MYNTLEINATDRRSCKRKPVVSFNAPCLSYSLSQEKQTAATNILMSSVFIRGHMLIIINAVSLVGGLLVELATHW